MIVAPGTTSISLDVQLVDDSGLPVTGLVAATFPAVSWSLAGNTAATSITLSDLAAITSAYSSGGVKERSGGYYRLDLPNAALATAGEVRLIGEATGKHLLAPEIVVAKPAVTLALADISPAVNGPLGLRTINGAGSYHIDEVDGDVNGSVAGNVAGDVQGKILGGGISTPTSAGVYAMDGAGNAIAKESDLTTALTDLGTLLSRVTAAVATASAQATLQTSATAIKAKTDLIATNAADSPELVTALGTISTNLNTTVSSRLASAAFTTLIPTDFATMAIGSGGKVAATIASGDGADAAANKTTLGAAGAGLTAVPYTGPSAATIQSGLATDAHVLALGTPMQATAKVVLNASQTDYAPAKAGDKMDLVNAPNATALNASADALLDRAAAIDPSGSPGETPRKMMRLLGAIIGKLSGAATSTNTLTDTSGTKNRIVSTTDSTGNRTAVTYDNT